MRFEIRNSVISLTIFWKYILDYSKIITAKSILGNYDEAKRLTDRKRTPKNFFKKLVTTLGALVSSAKRNDWVAKNVQLLMVKNGLGSLIDEEVFETFHSKDASPENKQRKEQ